MHGVQLVVGSPRAQVAVAVEGVVEREAVRYPAVMRPGVQRARLLAFVPHETVVMQICNDLKNEDGEHGLPDKEDSLLPCPKVQGTLQTNQTTANGKRTIWNRIVLRCLEYLEPTRERT
jgi:hypothetical protein